MKWAPTMEKTTMKHEALYSRFIIFFIFFYWKCRIWCEGWADVRSLIRFYVVVLSHAHLVFIQPGSIHIKSVQMFYWNQCLQRAANSRILMSTGSFYVTFVKKLNWILFRDSSNEYVYVEIGFSSTFYRERESHTMARAIIFIYSYRRATHQTSLFVELKSVVISSYKS